MKKIAVLTILSFLFIMAGTASAGNVTKVFCGVVDKADWNERRAKILEAHNRINKYSNEQQAQELWDVRVNTLKSGVMVEKDQIGIVVLRIEFGRMRHFTCMSRVVWEKTVTCTPEEKEKLSKTGRGSNPYFKWLFDGLKLIGYQYEVLNSYSAGQTSEIEVHPLVPKGETEQIATAEVYINGKLALESRFFRN